MAFFLHCPNCGERAWHEFWYDGEYEAERSGLAEESLEANFERVWLRTNSCGRQVERWFHFAGCNRWITVTRDTRSNEVT
jgi:sarcosine oxidase subunit delta